MGAFQGHPSARARFNRRNTLYLTACLGAAILIAPALRAEEASSISATAAEGPRGVLSQDQAKDPAGVFTIDRDSAWTMPPGGAMPRGPGGPILLYDNGPPLDDFNDPSSQVSLEADGASSIWAFTAAAADNFLLPAASGSSYRITTVRVAVDFFGSGSASASPISSWTHGVYVTIYGHAPLNQPGGAPTVSGSTVSFTGDVIASTLVPQEQLINEVAVNTGCRTVHTVDIPVDIVVAAETKYWISVMPRYAAPPQTAWCLSSGTAGVVHPAHRGSTFDVPFWTAVEGNSGACTGGTPGTKKELSFQLFGGEIESDIGACCNSATGECMDVDRGLDPNACTAPDEVFTSGVLCSVLSPACDEGACCFIDQFNDEDCELTNEMDCLINLQGHAFRLGEVCSVAIDCSRPPANDDCVEAELLQNGNNISVPFNSANATTELATPATDDCGQIERDIWFKWSASCTGTVVMTTFGSAFDTRIAVYGNGTNVCPPCPTNNDNLLHCDDDNEADPGTNYSILAFPVIANECLLIRVGGAAGAQPEGGEGIFSLFCVDAGEGACCKAATGVCDMTLEADCSAPGDRWFENEPCGSPNACQSNDGCTSPLILPSQSFITQPYNSTNATTTPAGQPTDCGVIAQDLWFSYEASCTGALTISTAGSAYDTFLAVYDFSGIVCPDPTACGDLEARELICSDEVGTEEVSFNVTAGDCLMIRVGGKDLGDGLSGGPGVLTISCLAPDEGACCHDDGSPCTIEQADNCLAPDVFFAGQLCVPDICPNPPANDDCINAIELSGADVDEMFDTSDATAPVDSPLTLCGTIVNDIWYTYTMPCDGTLLISTTGSSFDTRLAVYGQTSICPAVCPLPAPDGSFTERVCDDDISPEDPDSQVILPAVMGDCILIRVGGAEGGGSGELHIDCLPFVLGACCHTAGHTCTDAVELVDCGGPDDVFFPGEVCNNMICPAPPENDECAGALSAPVGTTPFDTTFATDSEPPLIPTPECPQPTRDIWYTFEPLCTGSAVISLCGATAFDATLAVYPDCTCPPVAQPLVCDNDSCLPGGAAEVTFSVVLGECYLVRIGGVAGAGGVGSMQVSCTPATCCPGDVDLSGTVDFDDVAELVALLLAEIGSEHPAFCAADVNGDGVVNGVDIDAFINVLFLAEPCEPPVLGACCHEDDTCTVLSPEACAADGGAYLGDNSTCSPNPCGLPEGACCMDETTCAIMTEAACGSGGGQYRGDETTCEAGTCTGCCISCCPGDFSGNAAIDVSDIADFVDALLAESLNGLDQCHADMNLDTSVDGLDVQAFTDALMAEQVCP